MNSPRYHSWATTILFVIALARTATAPATGTIDASTSVVGDFVMTVDEAVGEGAVTQPNQLQTSAIHEAFQVLLQDLTFQFLLPS